VLSCATAAFAFDARQTFAKGSFVLSPEVGYANQFNLENHHEFTDVQYVTGGVRLGWLPFEPLGPGPLFGSFEVGPEIVYHQYFEPKGAFYAGAGVALRYHFLSLGRFVPYIEAAGTLGGTNLKVFEIDSTFTFVVWGGLGASYFVGDRTAVYGGYRYEHISNGGTEVRNRGIESNSGVFGVSFFFE
jgi:lipid A 3-O-deacylase